MDLDDYDKIPCSEHEYDDGLFTRVKVIQELNGFCKAHYFKLVPKKKEEHCAVCKRLAPRWDSVGRCLACAAEDFRLCVCGRKFSGPGAFCSSACVKPDRFAAIDAIIEGIYGEPLNKSDFRELARAIVDLLEKEK